MKTMDKNKMTGTEYYMYISEECKRQWSENQEEVYGAWDKQTPNVKEHYFNQMYDDNMDLLGKCCCDCCYAGEYHGKFFCDCGDSDEYEKEIQERTYCDCFEEL